MAALALAAAAALAGCGGASTVTVTVTASPKLPPAPIGRGVPSNYRATQVWHVDLSGDSVPEVVVASVGPPVTSFNFHSADLRVLEWDALAHRWSVAFDAQKVVPRESYGEPGVSNSGPGVYAGGFAAGQQTPPLLDPKADVTLGSVRFGALLPGQRKQLLFSAFSNYGGSGVPGVLAVIDFKGGVANLIYSWSGEGLDAWKVVDGRLQARAAYWTPADPHCCALRDYRFTIAPVRGYLTETSDERPWLGVTVRELSGQAMDPGPLQVLSFADQAPARGALRVGDVLLDVLNAPPPPPHADSSAASTIFGKLNLLNAGQTAKLLVERGGARITVAVKLGSMKDCYAVPLPDNDYTVEAL